MNLQDLFENTAGASDIGNAIKALYQKIYAQGDDAVEFMYYDSPVFAQYWDEYEGDLDSIIAEIDPSELQIIYSELHSAAEDQGLAEGNFTKTPSGDYVNMHTGVRTSTSPAQKKVRGYKWEVHFDYGPHMSDSVIVTATSENEARTKAKKAAQKAGRSIMINWAEPVEQGVAEAEKNPHTSAIGKALHRDLSKEKKASPAQVEKNKARWAQRQADKEQGVAEMDKGSPQPGRDGRVSHSTYGSRDKHNVPNGPDVHLGPDSMLDRKHVGKKFSNILNKELKKAHK